MSIFKNTVFTRLIRPTVFALICIPQVILEFFTFATNRRINGYLLLADAAACLVAVSAVEIIKKPRNGNSNDNSEI